MSTMIERLGLKKILLIIIMLVFAVTIIFINKAVAEDTTPGNPAFDDTNFYQCVINAYNEANDANETIKSNLSDAQLKTITKLVCNGSKMGEQINDQISLSGLEKLTELTVLNIINYDVDEIHLENLTKLDFLQLFFTHIPAIDISHNTKLTSLNITMGNLTSIDISHNLELKTLDLNENKLTSLPNLELLTKLTRLDLSNNEFTTAPNIANLTYLQYLDLEHNHLSNIPSLHALTELQFLYLNNNELTSVPGLQSLINLQYLNLSNNKLTSDPDFQNLTLLEELNIGHNNLTSLTSFNTLQNLQKLDVSYNTLSEINLLNNPKLNYLNLEHNSLESINLSNNTFLKFLNLSYNNLSTIDLDENLKLSELVITNNKLASIEMSTNRLLTNIILDYNRLTSLNVGRFEQLETLSVAANELTNIDVNNNPELKVLNLAYNKISSLNITDSYLLSNIEIFNIDNNKFLSIPDYYRYMNKLKEKKQKEINNIRLDEYYYSSLGSQYFDIYLSEYEESYEIDLKQYDENLDPRLVSRIENENYTLNDGKISFGYRTNRISYLYRNSLNFYDISDVMEVTLKLHYLAATINNFYIGNTANDAYTNTLNVKVNLDWNDKNFTNYCISTENSSEHCVWKEASGQSVTEDYSLSSGDGKKTLYAFIKNSDGIIANSKSDSIILDTTKPVVQSVSIGGSNNPAYATNTSSNVYFSYEDEDVVSYCVKDTNDSSNCEWNNVTGKNMTIPYTLTSTNGTKTVYIFLKDRAGNVSVGKSDSIILDTTKPTIMAFYIGGSNNPSIITDNNTNVYLSWQDEDVASYCIKTENNTNNCDWKSVSGKSVNATYSLEETNGEKTLYAFIKDNAGLISSSKSDNVTLDSKKPIIDMFYIGGKTNPEVVGDTNTTIYLKWSDNDVTHYCVTEDSNSNNCVWKNTSGNVIEAEYILSGVNGLKTLNAYIKDSAGLISNVKSDSITLNTNKPLIKSFSINDNSKYTTNKIVTYKLVTEEENIESYCINTTNSSNNCNWINNSNQEITNTYTFDETDGIKTLYAFIKNNLEIISSVASDNIILDTTKPTITEFYIGGKSNPEYVNNKKTSIYATFKDNDIVSYCISTENKSSACEWKTINQNKIDIDYNINFLEDGTITLYLFAKDEAGLISDSKVDSIKLDTVKPMPKEFYIGSSKETNKTNSRNITINIVIEEEDIVSYCVSDTKDANKCVWKNVTSKNIKEDYVLTGDNGEKTIYLYLKDKAGNISEVKESKVLLELSNSTNNNNNSSSNNETEKDEPLQSSPQTGNRETCIIVIISGLIMLFIFYRLKKKNYIFKV